MTFDDNTRSGRLRQLQRLGLRDASKSILDGVDLISLESACNFCPGGRIVVLNLPVL